jgi:hypothetical protein
MQKPLPNNMHTLSLILETYNIICDKSPRKIPYYRLNHSTLVIKQ